MGDARAGHVLQGMMHMLGSPCEPTNLASLLAASQLPGALNAGQQQVSQCSAAPTACWNMLRGAFAAHAGGVVLLLLFFWGEGEGGRLLLHSDPLTEVGPAVPCCAVPQRLYEPGVLYADDLRSATAKRAVQRCASLVHGRLGPGLGAHSLSGTLPGSAASQVAAMAGPKVHDVASYWVTNGAGFSHDRLAALANASAPMSMQGVQAQAGGMLDAQAMQAVHGWVQGQAAANHPLTGVAGLQMPGASIMPPPMSMLLAQAPPDQSPLGATAPCGPSMASVFAAACGPGPRGPCPAGLLAECGQLPSGLTAADYYQAQLGGGPALPGGVRGVHKVS